MLVSDDLSEILPQLLPGSVSLGELTSLGCHFFLRSGEYENNGPRYPWDPTSVWGPSACLRLLWKGLSLLQLYSYWVVSRITQELPVGLCGVMFTGLTEVRRLAHSEQHHSLGWNLDQLKKEKVSENSHSLLSAWAWIKVWALVSSFCFLASLTRRNTTFEPWPKRNPFSLMLLLSVCFITATENDSKVTKTHAFSHSVNIC